MAWSIVQQNEAAQNTGSTTVSATLLSPATAGNLVLVVVGSDDYASTPPTGFTESTGCKLQTNLGHYLWWKVAAGGETSVSYTIGSASTSVWQVFEIAGLTASPYDISAGQFVASGSSAYTTPSITPTAGERLIVASIGGSTSAANFTGLSAWLNSFVEQDDTTNTKASGTRDIIGMSTLSATADGLTGYSSGATYSPNATARTGIIIAFKVAAAGGTTVVSKAVATTWNAAAVAAKAVATTWNTATVVTDPVTTTWNVATTVTKSVASTWDTSALVSKTVATSWDVAGVATTVTKAVTTSWDAYATVAKPVSTTWDVAATATKTVATSWDVAGVVTKTVATSWDVAALGQVTKTVTTSWNTAAVVTKPVTTTWNVAASTSKAITASWDTAARVTATITAAWDVAESPTAGIVVRPDTGTTGRPATGTITRPDTGTVIHILTVVVRLYTGTISRP